jgi:hypothetical protein
MLSVRHTAIYIVNFQTLTCIVGFDITSNCSMHDRGSFKLVPRIFVISVYPYIFVSE